jgi:hypothetical protein
LVFLSYQHSVNCSPTKRDGLRIFLKFPQKLKLTAKAANLNDWRSFQPGATPYKRDAMVFLFPITAFILAAGGSAVSDLQTSAQSWYVQQAQHPFDNDGDTLPDLGMTPDKGNSEKHLAEMAKAFGEASMTDNGLDTGAQARQFAFGQLRDVVSDEVNQQVESWLSPWGRATIDVKVDDDGGFTGSHGDWFVPLQDTSRYLSWSQLGLTQQDDGLVGNVGIGQRWISGDWLLGYNTFYDNLLDENLARTGLGAEVWGQSLRFSANFYHRSPTGHIVRRRSSSVWHAAMTLPLRRVYPSGSNLIPASVWNNTLVRAWIYSIPAPGIVIRWR